MRFAFVVLALALIAGSASAANIARNGNVEGVPQAYQNQMDRGDALVVSVIAGTFTDLAPVYSGALVANGKAPDVIYDPAGNWPAMGGYHVVVVTTSDLWWTGYWFASDEAVLTSYLTGGGCLFLVGQDFLYARGSTAGWPRTTFGYTSVIEDVNWSDTYMEWDGTNGGPLAGLGGWFYACWAANPFFTDQVTTPQGVVFWISDTYGPAEGGSYLNKAVFSTVEFGCDNANINAVIARILGVCGDVPPPNAVEEATWGAVKNLYR